MRLFRLLKILRISFRHGLDEFALSHSKLRPLQRFIHKITFWRNLENLAEKDYDYP